jgi:hypothetical protein
MTADKILKKYEDDNEYHFHTVDRKWIIEAMEEYAALQQTAVMPRFTYRLYERGKVRTYEIGELDNPRTSPNEWCDRRLCEGFWGDEENCKKVVSLLNGA